jgi:hypothetical protein
MTGGSFTAHRLLVERTMEDGDEQARLLSGRRVEHGLACGEVTVGAGADDLVADRKAAL